MTRGKYAARAAERTAQLAVEHDLGTYQRKVREQHEEIQRLKARVRELEEHFQVETRRLRAERDEGVSPRTEALRLQIHGMQKDVGLARLVNQQYAWILGQMYNYLRIRLHMGYAEAVEHMICWLTNAPLKPTYTEQEVDELLKNLLLQPRGGFARLVRPVLLDTWRRVPGAATKLNSIGAVMDNPEVAERIGVTVPDDNLYREPRPVDEPPPISFEGMVMGNEDRSPRTGPRRPKRLR